MALSGSTLVTGAGGLLGANLTRTLLDSGKQAVALCHRHMLQVSGVRVLQADLTDRSATLELVTGVRPAWVVHCAALTHVDWCEEHPADAHRINVTMARHVAQAAHQVGARLLYISTDSVFDGCRGSYAEEDSTAPINEYARSKLRGEEAVLDELPDSLIVRTNIYGWNVQQKKSLSEWMLSQLMSGQPFPGFQDVIFNPLLANDLGQLLIEMMERQLRGVYHVASAEACSKYQFGVQLAEVFGLDRRLVRPASIDDCPLRAPRPKNSSLRTDRITRALGRPMPGLLAGLERLHSLRCRGEPEPLGAPVGG
jgi:dTDP-4-dehydrorhamnose reductase